MVEQRSINIAVVQRRLPHYRLPVYNKLVNENSDIKLTVYCGFPEDNLGGSGIGLNEEPAFVKRVKNSKLKLFNREFLFQNSLFKVVSRKKYDIVIFEGSLILLSNILILFLRKLSGGKNIIWIKGWPKSQKELWISRRFKKCFLSLADHFIVYGYSSISLLNNYGIKQDKITVAQNTVDVTSLLNAENKYSSDKADSEQVEKIIKGNIPYILNLGRITKAKKVVDIIDAYKYLVEKNEIQNLLLVIAGNGPEMSNLKEKCVQENISNIFFTGNVSDKDADLLLLNCFCCVFPGAVGLSINQAMAASKAVICADEPGPDSELLIHGENGLRYEKGNIKALGENIVYLFNNPGLAKKLGANAYEKIKTSATIKNMVEKIAEAILITNKK